jgi:hypothetical protein
VNTACKLSCLGAALLAAALVGCAQPRLPEAAPAAAPSTPTPQGRAYDIVSRESLLTILVFRGGLLASAGHNHVIASHSLTGTIRVPADPLGTTFEVHLPLNALTIDEPALRQALHREDFPPEVPEAARQGTRTNMLGEALLDAAHWPEIVLRSVRIEAQGQGSGGVLAAVQASVRGQERLLTVPVHYQLQGEVLTVSGELTLKQTQLGLTPFSAFLGALAVQDEMQVRFQLVARAASPPISP